MAQWGPDAIPPCGKQCFSDQLKLFAVQKNQGGCLGLWWEQQGCRSWQPEGFGVKPGTAGFSHHFSTQQLAYFLQERESKRG